MGKIQTLLYTFRNRISLKKQHVKISYLATIDSKCSFGNYIAIARFSNLHNVKIGDYSYVENNCTLNHCEIGKFCSISSNVSIGLPVHPIDQVATSPVFYSNENRLGISFHIDPTVTESIPTRIGNDVWIGTNALIMGGLSIGNGAIIAAGAVVTKNVPPYAVVGGVPAKVIKTRFNEMIIAELEKTHWWDYDSKELHKVAAHMVNPEEFLNTQNQKYIVRKN